MDEKFNNLGENVNKLDSNLSKLTGRVNQNGKKLSSLERRIVQLENGTQAQESPGIVPLGSCQWPSLQEPAGGQLTIPPPRGPSDFELKMFNRSRRSLKIFPIEGKTEAELRYTLVDFCTSVLCLPRSIINEEAIDTIRRLAPTRYSSNEVLAVFKEVSVRDSIIAVSYTHLTLPTNREV